MKKLILMFSAVLALSMMFLVTACGSTGKKNNTETELFNVVFDSDGGSAVATQRVKSGNKATEPTPPTKLSDASFAYTFAGWYINETEFKFDTPITEDLTLKAKWTSNYVNYTVVFKDADGTELLKKEDYHYGDTVTVPEVELFKESDILFDYEFAGWDSEVVEVASNVIYTATYTATAKEGYKAHKVSVNGDKVILGAGEWLEGSRITGVNEDDELIDQAYLAFDGNFGLNSYLALDFTGKNMPTLAFFAKNYNQSMYTGDGSKEGIVILSGFTNDMGEIITGNPNGSTYLWDGKGLLQVGPHMVWMTDRENSDVQVDGKAADVRLGPGIKNSALGRDNLVDGTRYRVIIGNTRSGAFLTTTYYLYNLDTNEKVEQSSMTTYGFFTNAWVGGSLDEFFQGAIVAYGHQGTTTTFDKIYDIFENTTLEEVIAKMGLEGMVVFKDEEGNILQKNTINIGEIPVYKGEVLQKESDEYFDYVFGWDKEIAPVKGYDIYTVKFEAIAKSGYSAHNVTVVGEKVILGAGTLGEGAKLTGNNNDGLIDQSYLAFDSAEGFGIGSYFVADFTGKNMPILSFFAKNYNNSMYTGSGNKSGVVVATGFTNADGTLWADPAAAGSQDIYDGKGLVMFGPRMLWMTDRENPEKVGTLSMDVRLRDKDNVMLGRANLVDGTHYRIIIGFSDFSGKKLTLRYYLYNLDTQTKVDELVIQSWGFFSDDYTNGTVGTNAADFVKGSIVAYGNFGTTTTLDKIYGIMSGTTIENILDSFDIEYDASNKISVLA